MPSRVKHMRHMWYRCERVGSLLTLVVIAVISTRESRTESTTTFPAITVPQRPPPVPVLAPQIPSAPRSVLTARVIANGTPVADADVSISDGSSPALATARTDREGVVQFDALAPGAYELWAVRDAQASRIMRISEVTTNPLDLVLEPASRVRGEVTVDGPVPPGATVQLVPRDVDHVVRIAALDERGHFAIDGVPYGHWRVETSVPGHVQLADQILHVTAGETALVVGMQRAGTVRGTVVDAAGTPIANATIVLRDQALPAPATQRPFTLEALGLRWVHPLAGSRLLPVNDSGRFGALRPGSRPAECTRGHCGLDLGSVRGSIVHAAADGEIAAVFAESRTEAGRVVVIDHGGGLKTFYMHLDELRAGFEVGQPIRAGEPVGTLGSTGFTRAIPHLHFAMTYESGGRTWYIDPEPMIRSAVVLATPRTLAPVDPAALVPLAREPGHAQPVVHRFTADARGGFRIDGVAPGSYAAAVFATGFAPGASPAFTVKRGEDTTGVIVTLRAGAMVSGRVLGRDGPIAGATVLARAGFGEDTYKIATTTTDRYGEFALRSLAGKLTLAVAVPSYGEAERTISLDAAADHVARREEFQLTLEDAHLRGQVLAPDGGAAAGVTVRVIDGPSRRRAVTDAQGRFALDRVASGRYVLELASPEYPSKRVTVDSARWSEHRLEAGGGARCLVRDARSGAPLAGIHLEGSGAGGGTTTGVTDARGLVELRGLVPGDWKLTARTTGYVTATQIVPIRVGRVPQDVSLELAPGATLAGVVRDRQGHRVAGAHVTLGPASAVTDRDGNFRITDAASGVLEVEHDGHHGALPLKLAPGDERLSIPVELVD
jgi:murein DD-endopeptidase MepM/ murein hydrolase activator NlpD